MDLYVHQGYNLNFRLVMHSKKKKILIYIAIGVSILIVMFFLARNYIEIDICLDRGGRWNYETDLCEYDE